MKPPTCTDNAMNTAARPAAQVATLIAIFMLVACGGDGTSSADKAAEASPQVNDAASTTADPLPKHTAQLDSVAALGHSNVTGTMSDPKDPYRDAHENSWATGDNPQVHSLYRRLLADHPALEGRNYNLAVNGATIDALESQYEELLSEAEVAPDVIFMQFIDNDIRCDGTDTANAKAFGRTLDAALGRIAGDLPSTQFYLTGPWASVGLWTAWAARHEAHVLDNSGSGPCDVFDGKGRPRPAGMRSMQQIIDSYRGQMETVCSRHPGCFTDDAALETFKPQDRDLSADLNHLSIAGHRKYAQIAWSAMPNEIKERP